MCGVLSNPSPNEITLKHDSTLLFEAKSFELSKPMMKAVLACRKIENDLKVNHKETKNRLKKHMRTTQKTKKN